MTASSDETIRSLSLRLIEQALPVRETSALLTALASTWHAAMTSEIVVGLWDGDTWYALRLFDDQGPAVSRQPLPEWTTSAFFEATDSQTDRGSSRHLIREFVVDGQPIGGVKITGRDSLSVAEEELFRLSTKLAEQWRACDRELRERKLEALAEFAAGAGHEINNPLATIAGRATLLLRTETDPERRRALEMIGGQAYRVRDMIGDAMTFARPPAPQPTTFDPLTEIRGLLATFAARFAEAHIVVQVTGTDSLMMEADREQFRVFVSCLLRNELEALSAGGEFSINIQRVPRGNHDVVRITLRDNGPGLSEADREHLFDPFYSGRPAGRGLGFGLSKCWRIVRMHGGNISAGGAADAGFWLTADWPVQGAATGQNI